ncbi:uncharacterized protein HD556DRAFT_1303093 [Suillus plorans]|uniref:Uncharacterized protein n=1 Tax=Suillus plorans TaxID=116603 RepID=A0A9P7DZ78_9AGAM|nr:uncharacterized protein HD556DRAFT_1303093 [Suillus plorans]KAG1806684.1 hypothetical protein HD556DRAFT_1303093 [Suillus plorans]
MNSEHSILDIVGILAVPSHNKIMFSEVYEKKKTGDGDFLQLIDSKICRPNVLGLTSVVWPLSMLNDDDSIHFHVAPFPDGFSPCGSLSTIEAAPLHDFMLRAPRAAIEVTPLVYQFLPPATLTRIEAEPFEHSISLPPADGEGGSTFFPPGPSSNGQSWSTNFDFGFNFPTVTGSEGYLDNSMFDDYQMASDALVGYREPIPITPMIVLHKQLIWKGVDAPLHPDYRSAITEALKHTPWNCPIFLTNCFLTVIALSGTTMDELHDQLSWLVTVVTGKMEFESIGWDMLRLTFLNHIVNRTSDMRKVVWGCIHTPTGFSENQNQAKQARVDYFFVLLDLDNRELVQQGIMEATQLHMFQELVWIALLQPTIGLAQNRNENGRIADLFPEEVRSGDSNDHYIPHISYLALTEDPGSQTGSHLSPVQGGTMNSGMTRSLRISLSLSLALGIGTVTGCAAHPLMHRDDYAEVEQRAYELRADQTRPDQTEFNDSLDAGRHKCLSLFGWRLIVNISIWNYRSFSATKLLWAILKMSRAIHTACMGPLPVRDRKVLTVVVPRSRHLAAIKDSFVRSINKVKSLLWLPRCCVLKLPCKIPTEGTDPQTKLLSRSIPIWPTQLRQYTKITLLESLSRDYNVQKIQIDFAWFIALIFDKVDLTAGIVTDVKYVGIGNNLFIRQERYTTTMREVLESWIEVSRTKLNRKQWLLVIEPTLARGKEIYPYCYVVPENRIITWIEPVDGYLLFQECMMVWNWNHKRLELEAQYWKHVEYFLHGIEICLSEVPDQNELKDNRGLSLRTIYCGLDILDFGANERNGWGASHCRRRLRNKIGHHEYLNHHGQPEARLMRTHSLGERRRDLDKSPFMASVTVAMLWIPIMVLERLRKIYVDDLVNGMDMRGFIDNFSAQAKSQTTVASVIMAVNASILAIPGLGSTLATKTLCSISFVLSVHCIIACMVAQQFGH